MLNKKCAVSAWTACWECAVNIAESDWVECWEWWANCTESTIGKFITKLAVSAWVASWALCAKLAVSDRTDWYACWDLDDFKAKGTDVNGCLGDNISSPTWVSNSTLGEMFNGKGFSLPKTTEKTPLLTLVEWLSSQTVCSVPSFISRIKRKVNWYSPSSYAIPSVSVNNPWNDILLGTSDSGCAIRADVARIISDSTFFITFSYFKKVIFCLKIFALCWIVTKYTPLAIGVPKSLIPCHWNLYLPAVLKFWSWLNTLRPNKSNIWIFISDSSEIEKSIFTVGLNGFGYALEMEKSSGITSSTSSVICATLPQKPEVKILVDDTALLVNTCPIVPTKAVCSDWAFTVPLDITDWGMDVFWANT